MTQISESASSEQDLLDKLIRQGLTQSVKSDYSRYRKILEILFQQCVLKPVQDPGKAVNFEHISLWLAILDRQCIEKPDFLYFVEEDSGPTYQWLLPRLVHAAVSYDAMSTQDNLSELLLQAAVKVLRAMERVLDTPGKEGSFSLGTVHSVAALMQLKDLASREHSMYPVH